MACAAPSHVVAVFTALVQNPVLSQVNLLKSLSACIDVAVSTSEDIWHVLNDIEGSLLMHVPIAPLPSGLEEGCPQRHNILFDSHDSALRRFGVFVSDDLDSEDAAVALLSALPIMQTINAKVTIIPLQAIPRVFDRMSAITDIADKYAWDCL